MLTAATTPRTPPSKLRVLLVSPLPPPEGGISTWTAQVLEAVRSSPSIHLKVVDTAVRWRAVTRQSPLIRLFGGSAHALIQIFRVIWIALSWRPAVLHLCTSAGAALFKDCVILAFCRLFGVPSIIHFRFGRIPELSQQHNLEWRLLRWTIRLSSCAVVIDRSSRGALRPEFNRKLLKLPNFIDIDRLRREMLDEPAIESAKGRSIVFVGHVLPTKGVGELIIACRELRVAFPDLHLVIAGPCSAAFQSDLIQQAGDSGAASWLEFTGALPHPAALHQIARAGIFCLPTYTEGFPNTILEAMALARPIVATAVGAIPEMLRLGLPDACGIAAEPRSAAALKIALNQALSDSAGAQTLAQRAHRRCVRLYDRDRVVPRLIRIWQTLGAGTHRTAGSSRALSGARPELLVVNQVAGPLTVELLAALSSRGWDCQVLCGEIEADAGLPSAVRVKTSVRLVKDRLWQRLRTWALFACHAVITIARSRARPVLVVTNPPLTMLAMPLLARLLGVKYALLIHDVYPDVAERMKMVRVNGWIARSWRAMSRASLRRASAVVTIGESMKALLRAHLRADDDCEIDVIPTWVNTHFIRPIKKLDNPFIAQQHLEGKFIVMYSGAFGATHDIQTVIDAAELLVDEPAIRFLLVGGGTHAKHVDEQLKRRRLPNVSLLPFRPRAEIPFSMSSADCSIVSLDSAYGGVSVPSKTYYALASGSAVLAICPGDSELSTLLGRLNCGVQICPRDAAGLVAAIRSLHRHPDRLHTLQQNARLAAERHYSLEQRDRLAARMTEALSDTRN